LPDYVNIAYNHEAILIPYFSNLGVLWNQLKNYTEYLIDLSIFCKFSFDRIQDQF
jgi:hypothetical protein